MKMISDVSGRFPLRPHYEPAELDRECEHLVRNFFKLRYGAIKFPLSTDDLTALVETEADDLDLYADLSRYGTGVEGVTLFEPGAKPRVQIANELSEKNRENRLRTTLTHELGHVHFHSYLFDPALGTMNLFKTEGSAVKQKSADKIQVCKRDNMLNASRGDWMEWQAGHVCGAILMPATAVRDLIKAEFEQHVASHGQPISRQIAAAMIEQTQGAFKVSQEAARVRLMRLNVIQDTPNDQFLF